MPNKKETPIAECQANENEQTHVVSEWRQDLLEYVVEKTNESSSNSEVTLAAEEGKIVVYI